MLSRRLITGPVLIALLLAVVALDEWLGAVMEPRGIALFGLALIAITLAAVEFAPIIEAGGIRASRGLTAVAAVIGLALMYGVAIAGERMPLAVAAALLATGPVAVLILGLFTFSRGRNVHGVLPSAGGALLAMTYLGLLPGFYFLLRDEHSAWWIAGIILVTKSCDIGAYFTGTAIGRRKLIPWLSPGKTWEGLAGGIAAAVLIGVAMAAASRWLPDPADHLPLLIGAAAGAIFAVAGQFGDLVMSLFKRGAGVKDTSSIVPGMGGVLDVIDSPLMVAPFAYWLLTLAA